MGFQWLEICGVMKADEKIGAVLLVWSLPDEAAFVNAVRSQFGRIAVCPLRMPALHAARRLLAPEEILDPADVLPVAERLEVFDEATAAFNRFVALFRGQEPWFDGAEVDTSGPLFYYFFLWRRLIRNLDARCGRPRLLHYGVFSKLSLIGLYTNCADLLGALVERRAGAAEVSGLRRAAEDFAVALGGVVNARPQLFSSAGACPAVPRGDLVLASPAEGDRWVQTEIAKRLAERGADFLLLASGEMKVKMSADEAAFNEGLDAVAAKSVLLPPYWRMRRWRRGPWGALHRRFVRRRFHDALCAAGGGDASRGEWLVLADFLATTNGDRALDWLSVESVLDAARPKTVVVQSGTYTTPLVNVWCERRGVKTVRLPHGMEHSFWHGYWRGDVLGVMGRHTEEELKAELPGGTGMKFARVGGVHVAQMIRGARTEKRPVVRRALLIHSGSMFIRPDCDSEQERFILDLAEQLSAVGVPLHIRFHPRQEFVLKPDHALVAEVGAKRGIAFTVADSAESLTQQVADSAVTINQTWSGACLAPLFERVPLIAWMPGPHIAPYAKTQEMMPLRGANGREVATLAKRLCDDAEFRAESLRAQDDVLAELIEDPQGDPYGRSVELVLREAGIK